jgi:hypothetical protein
MKAEIKKCIVLDGKPFLTVVAAAKSLAQLAAARMANRIAMATIEAGVEHRYRYSIYGSWVPTQDDLDKIQYHRKRAFARYKKILEKKLAA